MIFDRLQEDSLEEDGSDTEQSPRAPTEVDLEPERKRVKCSKLLAANNLPVQQAGVDFKQ